MGWPLQRVSYPLRSVVYGDSLACPEFTPPASSRPFLSSFLLQWEAYSRQFNVSVKICTQEEDLDGKRKPNSQSTLYAYTVITLGLTYSSC